MKQIGKLELESEPVNNNQGKCGFKYGNLSRAFLKYQN